MTNLEDNKKKDFKVGDSVTHPLFPQWGRGIIIGIMLDTEYKVRIARVMWQSLNSDKCAFHTMEHLDKFIDYPTLEKAPEQLELF